MRAKYSQQDLIDIDRRHVWHPYASVTEPGPIFPVTSARGVRLELANGDELIDGMSSWWCAIHGYNHPVLNAALHAQIDTMSHVMFGGLTHPGAVELSELLIRITPPGLDRVFFCDSGSVSVEVGIKMAIQYWLSKKHRRKNKLLTIRGGYHGDTFGAMAVCDPVNGMHEMFGGILARHFFVESPGCTFAQPCAARDLDEIKKLMAEQHEQLAAVILEPVVQGAGGMKFYSPEYLKHVRLLCDEYGVLLICDEIATGFGRSGVLFACEHAAISPDIMCVGKALTGGYMTLAATLCSDKVAHGICDGTLGVFMHGPTFMANPLACAVATASIRLLLSTSWEQRIAAIEDRLLSGLSPCRGLSGVSDVRVLGAIGVVELHQPVDMRKITVEFVKRGVWVRPFGKLIYLMPPYIIEDDDLDALTRAICEVVEATEHQG